MIKKLPFLILLATSFGFSQGISVDNTTYTPQQLVTDVLTSGVCGSASNVATQGGNCGIGYFNANNSNFPFAEGLVLRSGTVSSSAGQWTGNQNSTVCSGLGGGGLQVIAQLLGQNGSVNDVTSLTFDFIPTANSLSFNFVFASNEYGTFQCTFGDVFAFTLTDMDNGVTQNMAVVPGTFTPIAVTTIRDTAYNTGCPSVNAAYFGQYNVANPAASAINMNGQTNPMTAFANVTPGHTYQLTIAVGDYQDSSFDSAVFIEGGSFAFSQQCQDHIQMISFYDLNGNGTKENTEPIFPNGQFIHQANNSGTLIYSQSTASVIILPENATDSFDMDFAIAPAYAPYFGTSASYQDITVVQGSGANYYYFPIVNTNPFTDVSVSMQPLNPPRAGESRLVNISVTNIGTQTASGVIQFAADPANAYETISAVSDAAAVYTDYSMSLPFADVLPGETRTVTVTLQVASLPTVSLGQLLTESASVTTANDAIANNDAATLAMEIVGAFDPNFKTESHGRYVSVAQFGADDYLHYTVHFQNIGTSYARNVRIEDVLDAQLDESTVTMVNASHPYVMQREATNLAWTFDNIYLPGVVQSEADSQGFVHFKVKPKPGFEAGDIVMNQASIFFDSNPPIVTNTAVTEFTTSLGQPDVTAETLKMYPNPAHSEVNISSPAVITSIRITDLLGKNVMTQSANSMHAVLDVSKLETGIYLLEADAGGQQHVLKLAIKR